jgi:hypothetical protein
MPDHQYTAWWKVPVYVCLTLAAALVLLVVVVVVAQLGADSY